MNIAFIGLGKLGGPCAEIIAQKNHDVYGYDINPNIKLKGVNVTNNLIDLNNSDIIFIAVPTPHDSAYGGELPTSHLPPKDFDYSIVKQTLNMVDQSFSNKLIVLISTVLPGTVRRELQPLVKNNRFIYNPYLIAMGTVGWDMVNPEMIMIGTKDGNETGDAKQLVDFYKTIMENDPRYVIGTWDECECLKIFYNTWISFKLSFVNMIQDVAEKQGNINVDVVTTALSDSTIRIMSPMYMKAGMGDGGACVLPSFNVNIDKDDGYDTLNIIKGKISISDLYNNYYSNHAFSECIKSGHYDRVFSIQEAKDAIDNGRIISSLPVYLVESTNYACNSKDKKKISNITKRKYSGKLYTFLTKTGKRISVTEDHLIPVERNRKRIIIKAKDIIKTDKLYVL